MSQLFGTKLREMGSDGYDASGGSKHLNINQLLRFLRPILYRRGKSQKWVLLLVGLLVGYSFLQPYLQRQLGWNVTNNGSRGGVQSEAVDKTSAGEEAIISAFENQRSNIIVQTEVQVIKLLRDDNEGDRHQKMLLRLPSRDHTLLLTHNIDLAKRVPAEVGDTLTVRGEYEYSDQGGVVHWTHHDPRGSHSPGWIELRGERYE